LVELQQCLPNFLGLCSGVSGQHGSQLFETLRVGSAQLLQGFLKLPRILLHFSGQFLLDNLLLCEFPELTDELAGLPLLDFVLLLPFPAELLLSAWRIEYFCR
jgi:hypothetical protein